MPGRSVVVSGDAKASQSLIEAATGADLLLQSAWMTEARNPTPPALRSIASAEDAGRVFAKARPRLAVLYHYAEETGIEEAVRENYQGSFGIGRDRMEIEGGDTTKWRGGR
jgi:ribonuclease BN (tRNA processing enzyme)